MARVIPRKAKKDYPAIGVVKGDQYFTWQLRSQRGIQRSKTRPTRAQLTSSEFLQTAYNLVDIDLPAANCADDIEALKTSIEEAGELARDSYDNLTPGLQAGPAGEKMEQRQSDADDFANTIDTAHTELVDAIEAIDARETEWNNYEDEKSSWEAMSEEEQEAADEPEEPSEEAEDWEQLRNEALDACKEEISGSEPSWE